MTQAIDPHQERRTNWIARVQNLAREVAAWCEDQGWTVEQETKVIHERALGDYTVPMLHVIAPSGELLLNPIGLIVIGGDGRVDLESFPSLSRVKLVGDANGWTIMTDSNVPLRQPWNRQTFVQLAEDLLA